MNFITVIIAFSLFGQGSNVERIVPEGMDYNTYLEAQFQNEAINELSFLTNVDEQVVIYDNIGNVVAEGKAKFIGDIIDTEDVELIHVVNKSDFLMEMGNTRIYRLDK